MEPPVSQNLGLTDTLSLIWITFFKMSLVMNTKCGTKNCCSLLPCVLEDSFCLGGKEGGGGGLFHSIPSTSSFVRKGTYLPYSAYPSHLGGRFRCKFWFKDQSNAFGFQSSFWHKIDTKVLGTRPTNVSSSQFTSSIFKWSGVTVLF